MRRMVLFVTVALLAAVTIAAGAFPTYARQARAKEQGRVVGAGTCTVEAGGSHATIQAAVDDPGTPRRWWFWLGKGCPEDDDL